MSVNPNKVSNDFSSVPQIAVEDMAQIAAQGYKTIINCRPDREGGAEQPLSDDLKRAAEKAGLGYVHIPVIPGNITQDNVAACAAFIANAPAPILGFCKTGVRAGNLYQLASSNAGSQNKSVFAKACEWLKSKCLIRRLWLKLKGASSCKPC
jgi:uncharacterized protein (TIGR01244 family)